MSVLGALLLGGNTVGEILQMLEPGEFYRSAHGLIFSAIKAVHDKRAEIDTISVAEDLRRRGMLAECGAEDYLIQLAERMPSTASAAHHAKIVREKATLRRMITVATDTARNAFEARLPAGDLLGAMRRDMAELEERTAGTDDLIDMDQMLAMPDPDYLVADMLPAGEVCTLIGDTGTYKSMLALRLALHVQYGLPFAGREVKQGQVVYLDQEGGRGTKLRLRAILQNSDGQPDPSFDRQHGRPIFRQKPLPLLVPAEVTKFVVSVRKRHKRLALVVIDTLSVSIAGYDENAAEIMSAAVEAAKAIRDATGATVLIVHHTGRVEKNRSRGGYPIDCNPAGQLVVEREGDDRVKVTIKKNKDGPTGDSELFQFLRVEVGQHATTGKMQYGGLVMWQGPVAPPTAEDIKVQGLGGQKAIDKVLTIVKASHPERMSKKAIADDAGMRKETCNAILAFLRKTGRTTEIDGPRNSTLVGLVTAEVIS